VDMCERLLWLVGHNAAGNGLRDHKCVLRCRVAMSWKFSSASVAQARRANIISAEA
jgi:hypothetical protein